MQNRCFGIAGFLIALVATILLLLPQDWWIELGAEHATEIDVANLGPDAATNQNRSVRSLQFPVSRTTYISPDDFDSRYSTNRLGTIDFGGQGEPAQLRNAADDTSLKSNSIVTDRLLKDAGLNKPDRELVKNLPPVCTTGLHDYIENPDNDVLNKTLSQPLPPFDQFKDSSQRSQGAGTNESDPNSSDLQRSSGNASTFPPAHSGQVSGQSVPNQSAIKNHSTVKNHSAINFANYNPHKNASTSGNTVNSNKVYTHDPHLELYTKSQFPSAVECAQCHQQIFDEWASSSHAYSAISPMFHKFENTINRLAQGTIGYFCLRCHAPVATTVGLRRDQAIWDGPRVFREGVTCIVCHRVKEQYTKTNGERKIEGSPLNGPVFGTSDGKGVGLAIKYNPFYKVKTDPQQPGPGLVIHERAVKFEQLGQSDFCMSCHQVAVQPGIKLEVVWDQYRASPAYKNGTTCQDCHMGKVPGVDAGYSYGPAAVVSNRVVQPERKHSNHMFYGPGYSIAHPGIFPHNIEADRWTVNQWLQFDWRAGWGTDAFEDKIADGLIQVNFPPCWAEVDDRYDAREIIEDNLKKLRYKKDIRRQVMENGSKLDGPFFADAPQAGRPLKFHYCVSNTNPGHNMPSGSLGAQPQLWLNVVLIGPDGRRIWETGYLDTIGDLADLHSKDVLDRKVPHDDQLFNLQTKFLTTNVKGTDREMYLPVNFDFDQLPFIRPAAQPVTVINHPPFIRMEAHSIPPLGSRKAKYIVPAGLINQPGTYRLSVRLRSRAEPIYFMRFCGATPEMERMMNEWIVDAHPYTVVFEVK